MIPGILLVASSAILGGVLALAARRRPILLELTRTFAFAAAFGVVGFHLVPEILPSLRFEALVWIAAGFALPWVLEAVARMLGPGFLSRRGMHGLRVAAEVAFIALVFHSVVEGLALLAVVQSSERATDVQLAILAHHAPLTAAVALPFLELRGARSAAARVAVVGLSGVAGILLGHAVPGLASGTDAGLVQRATAMTAGALLHVVSDEIREQRFETRWERLADILAGLLGLGLAGLGAFLDLRNETSVVAVVRASVALALCAAPALLVGLAFRWATMRFTPRAAEPARAAVMLEHRDPALSIELFAAPDSNDVMAEWRLWGRVLGLPLLVANGEGTLSEPFPRLGAVSFKAPTARRRRRSPLAKRRPKFLARRRMAMKRDTTGGVSPTWNDSRFSRSAMSYAVMRSKWRRCSTHDSSTKCST